MSESVCRGTAISGLEKSMQKVKHVGCLGEQTSLGKNIYKLKLLVAHKHAHANFTLI